MKKMTWFERLKHKRIPKDRVVVTDSGLTTLASSNASLVKPSPSSIHECQPEPSLLPVDIEEKIDNISDTTPPILSSISSTGTDPTLTNIWERAIKALQNDSDSEKRELAQQYTEILEVELSGPESGPIATETGHLKHERIAESLNAKVEELSQERLTISLGSRELAIEPLFNNVSKHIVAARNLISSAAGAEPHAALACAGGLVILMFLVRPVEQREHILRGLELKSSLICRYFAMERV
ncbi:hypothetical protein BDP81DRAFT_398326 [Colletotrichum phormii]|uniref:NWD NACHT-NTPase N-terminal domain-containing protein n=1 Tax=Colletotrichum phormii TaxID=359342 RepID=A0AAJ0EB53_9PEZI|nr:uncharacterized protein BDP81DRAFT_398326 [Colletotrichum phormii]KAK1624690.1 hypothetical protein BDP81DRAFT_398326 [Colletotrichum phormii]